MLLSLLLSACAAPPTASPPEPSSVVETHTLDLKGSVSATPAPESTPSIAAETPAPVASVAPPPPPPFFSEDRFDIILRGGFVINGTGSARKRADVLIRNDRIAYVGDIDTRVQAKREMDATGLVITPGFFDTHAHGGPLGDVEYALAQGITTLVLGQDGESPAEHIGGWLAKVDASRPRVNIATLVGHATVRKQSGAGLRKNPSAKTIDKMRALVDQALREGAFGLSMGLEYDPGRSTEMTELVAIAEPVGALGGVVMSHLRSEDDDRIEASLDELFEQCGKAKARAHISHFKIVLGKGIDRAAQLLAYITEARERGISVTADIYPYAASYTSLSILFPDFARPPASYAEAKRNRRGELESFLRARVDKRNGPTATVFGTGAYAGKTLAAVAKEQGVPFERVLIDLGPNGAEAAYFVMDEAVVERLYLDPFVMVGTDGGGGGRHPRGFGAFARILDEYVGKRQLLTLEEAVRKMTSLPAETLGLSGDRGCLAPGCAADVLVFDPANVRVRADFSAPHRLATGMRYVIVNGIVERDNDHETHGRAGKALRFKPRTSL
jgi:N-acyl-D-aspartate/D-glutamate deacylase